MAFDVQLTVYATTLEHIAYVLCSRVPMWFERRTLPKTNTKISVAEQES